MLALQARVGGYKQVHPRASGARQLAASGARSARSWLHAAAKGFVQSSFRARSTISSTVKSAASGCARCSSAVATQTSSATLNSGSRDSLAAADDLFMIPWYLVIEYVKVYLGLPPCPRCPLCVARCSTRAAEVPQTVLLRFIGLLTPWLDLETVPAGAIAPRRTS